MAIGLLQSIVTAVADYHRYKKEAEMDADRFTVRGSGVFLDRLAEAGITVESAAERHAREKAEKNK